MPFVGELYKPALPKHNIKKQTICYTWIQMKWERIKCDEMIIISNSFLRSYDY
jgi:hypothetical protein